jgi:hypothetical protein
VIRRLAARRRLDGVVHWQQPLTQGLVLATTFARLSPVVPLVVAVGIIGLALFLAGRGGRRK